MPRSVPVTPVADINNSFKDSDVSMSAHSSTSDLKYKQNENEPNDISNQQKNIISSSKKKSFDIPIHETFNMLSLEERADTQRSIHERINDQPSIQEKIDSQRSIHEKKQSFEKITEHSEKIEIENLQNKEKERKKIVIEKVNKSAKVSKSRSTKPEADGSSANKKVASNQEASLKDHAVANSGWAFSNPSSVSPVKKKRKNHFRNARRNSS